MGVSRGVSSERAQRASRNGGGGGRGYDNVCWALGEAGDVKLSYPIISELDVLQTISSQ